MDPALVIRPWVADEIFDGPTLKPTPGNSQHRCYLCAPCGPLPKTHTAPCSGFQNRLRHWPPQRTWRIVTSLQGVLGEALAVKRWNQLVLNRPLSSVHHRLLFAAYGDRIMELKSRPRRDMAPPSQGHKSVETVGLEVRSPGSVQRERGVSHHLNQAWFVLLVCV